MTAAPPVDAWTPWAPADVAARLAALDLPWCVVGGWALDLFAGHQRRPHQDLEIAVPAARFQEVAARLDGCRLFVPVDGQLHCLADDPALLERSHQTWVEGDGRWRLDVMREPSDVGPGGQHRWVCRRDASLRLPYAEVIRRDQAGVPYLRPDLVLLFKAKAVRPKDQEDFDRTVPDLSVDERTRLAEWVAKVHGMEHPWVAALRPGREGTGGDASGVGGFDEQ